MFSYLIVSSSWNKSIPDRSIGSNNGGPHGYEDKIHIFHNIAGIPNQLVSIINGKSSFDHFNFFRLQANKVNLNNEGAKLVVLKESSLTLAEIEKDDYNFAQIVEHFGGGAPFESEFPLTLSKQKLACGGMLLMISFKHLLCDVNSFYVFVAELASQLKNSAFKFPKENVRKTSPFFVPLLFFV